MLHCPDCETVVPIVVVLRIDSSAVEVQVPSVAGTIERRRPVVAVRTAIVARRACSVAGSGEYLLLPEASGQVYKKMRRLSPIRHRGRTIGATSCLFFFSPSTKARRITYELVLSPDCVISSFLLSFHVIAQIRVDL